eukprot:UN19306
MLGKIYNELNRPPEKKTLYDRLSKELHRLDQRFKLALESHFTSVFNSEPIDDDSGGQTISLQNFKQQMSERP